MARSTKPTSATHPTTPASKSRFLTPEYFVAYLVLAAGYIYIIKELVEKSERTLSSPIKQMLLMYLWPAPIIAYNTGEKETWGVEDGWIPGRKQVTHLYILLLFSIYYLLLLLIIIITINIGSIWCAMEHMAPVLPFVDIRHCNFCMCEQLS